MLNICGIFSAAYGYLRQRRVDIRLALLFDTPNVLGVVIGAYMVVVLPSALTAMLMGFFQIFSALRLWRSGNDIKESKNTAKRGGDGPLFRRRLMDRYGNVYGYGLVSPTCFSHNLRASSAV
ncbi:MAG: sulfite exporter TauE/SafE family protein [Candidatus Brockarchaeota archaeon]|nr:sulfite exporter TauE/SafE family protein [Candidatus Brockarchaeota archaeon]